MEAYEKLNNIRENISDTAIVDELMQYMSTDELEEFVEHLIKVFDLEYADEIIESTKTKIRKRLLESSLHNRTFAKYKEIFDEFDSDIVCVENFDIHTDDGQLITHIGLTEDDNIVFFNGDPDSDDEWEEVIPSSNPEKRRILEEIYNLI